MRGPSTQRVSSPRSPAGRDHVGPSDPTAAAAERERRGSSATVILSVGRRISSTFTVTNSMLVEEILLSLHSLEDAEHSGELLTRATDEFLIGEWCDAAPAPSLRSCGID